MNFEDLIRSAFPGWALKRTQARAIMRAYEATKPSRSHKVYGNSGDADSNIFPAGESLRQQARWLDENHDLASGALNVMVQNVIGPTGIIAEPMPRTKKGVVIDAMIDDIRLLMEAAGEKPESTHEFDDSQMQRLVFRSWLRDGEFFAHVLEGNVTGLKHGSDIPLTLQLLEADYVPYDAFGAKGVAESVMGVVKDQWGRPTHYYVYENHPGDSASWEPSTDMKKVPARRMIHSKLVNRIGQTRGVSQFASVITRLNDLKAYEESERLAARISAALTVAIKKGSPELYTPEDVANSSEGAREFQMAPGMLFDQLAPGETVEVIESSRPNALLADFRSSMVRMVAAGLGGTFSSISKQYDGTYSAQRQELVEGYLGYRTIGQEFVSQFTRPVYRRRLALAVNKGLLKLPRDLDTRTLLDASYHSHAMPWIDPAKEAVGWETLAQAGFESEEAVIRSRGRKPSDVQGEVERFRAWAKEAGLQFSSNVADTVSQPNASGQQSKGKGQNEDKDDVEEDSEA